MKDTYFYEQKYIKIVKTLVIKVLKDFKCKVFLFGSRAIDKHKQGADFDIGIEGLTKQNFLKIKYEILEQIEESIVPYNVDIINFEEVDSAFKHAAYKEIDIWKQG